MTYVLVIDDDELWGVALLDRLKDAPWRISFHQGPFGTVNAIDCRNPNQLYIGEIGNLRVQKVTLHPAG